MRTVSSAPEEDRLVVVSGRARVGVHVVKRPPTEATPLKPVVPRPHPDCCDLCEESPTVLLYLANGVQICPECRKKDV